MVQFYVHQIALYIFTNQSLYGRYSVHIIKEYTHVKQLQYLIDTYVKLS